MASQFVPNRIPIPIVTQNSQWIAQELPAGSGNISISGYLFGDAIGPLDNTSVIRINSNPLGVTTPDTGNILVADGVKWNSVHPSGTIIITQSGSIYLQNTGVVPGTYGSGNSVAQITIGSDGRITNATNVTIDLSGLSQGIFFRPSLLLMGG